MDLDLDLAHGNHQPNYYLSLNSPAILHSLPLEILCQIACYLPLPAIRSLLLSNPRYFNGLYEYTMCSSFVPWRRRFFAYQRAYLRTLRETQDYVVDMKNNGQNNQGSQGNQGNIVASSQVRVRTASEQELEEMSQAMARDLGLLPALANGTQVNHRVEPTAPLGRGDPARSYAGAYSPILLPRINLNMVFHALEHLSKPGLEHLKLPSLSCSLSAITGILNQRYPKLELIQKLTPVKLLPPSSPSLGSVAETAAAYRIFTAYLLCTSLAPNDILGVLSDALSAQGKDMYAVGEAKRDHEIALVEYFHFLRLFLLMYEYDQTLRIGTGMPQRRRIDSDILSRQGRRVLTGRLDAWIRGYFRPERPLSPAPPPPAPPPSSAQRYNMMQSPSTPTSQRFERVGSMGHGTTPFGFRQGMMVYGTPPAGSWQGTAGYGASPSGPRQGTMSRRTSSWSTSGSDYLGSLSISSPTGRQQSVVGPKLTKEQEQIVVTEVDPGDLMKVRAYAGTGKTMSLVEYAKARPDTKFLYVAFNKSAQIEAKKKFPQNVDCKTMHSIAMQVLNMYAPRISDAIWSSTMEIPKYSFSARHVIEMLGLQDNVPLIQSALLNPTEHLSSGARKREAGKKLFPTANAVATTVKKTLENYWASKELGLTQKCVPWKMVQKLGLREDVVLKWAVKLWEEMKDARAKYLPHDAYLKLLFLDGVQEEEEGTGVGGARVGGTDMEEGFMRVPVRGGGDRGAFGKYEVIMFDEAQDSNPCMAGVILRQRPWTGLVIVGDPYQKIYGFRGATNECFDDAAHPPTHSFYLTHSFRFGDNIAGVANVLLRALRENVAVNGVREEDSVKRSLPHLMHTGRKMDILKPGEIEDGGSGRYTVIFRKNISLVEYAIQYCVSHCHLGSRISLHTARNYNKSSLFALLRTAYALFHNGTPARSGALVGYKSWEQLKDHVEAENSEDGSGGTDSPQLGLVVGLEGWIGKGDFLDTIAMCEEMVIDDGEEANADVILITTHQAKGQEWDRVVVADDFNPTYSQRGRLGKTKYWREEMFMTYVAVTRAKKELIVGERIATWLAGEMGVCRFYVSPVQGEGKCPICCNRPNTALSDDESQGTEGVQPRKVGVVMGYECLLPIGSFEIKITEPTAGSRRPFCGKKDVLVCDLCVQRWFLADRVGTDAELRATSLPLMWILEGLENATVKNPQDRVFIGPLTERGAFSAVYESASLAESNMVARWVGGRDALSIVAAEEEEGEEEEQGSQVEE